MEQTEKPYLCCLSGEKRRRLRLACLSRLDEDNLMNRYHRAGWKADDGLSTIWRVQLLQYQLLAVAGDKTLHIPEWDIARDFRAYLYDDVITLLYRTIWVDPNEIARLKSVFHTMTVNIHSVRVADANKAGRSESSGELFSI